MQGAARTFRRAWYAAKIVAWASPCCSISWFLRDKDGLVMVLRGLGFLF